MADFSRNDWPEFTGTPGRFLAEWVAAIFRIQWPFNSGMPGRYFPEQVAELLRNTHLPELTEEMIMQVEPVLHERLKELLPLANTALEVDKQVGFAPGTCLWIVQYLIVNRVWSVDMMQRIDTSKSLVVLSSTSSANSKEVS